MHSCAGSSSSRAGSSLRHRCLVRAAVAAPEAPPAQATAKTDAKSLYMPLQNGSDVRGVAVEGEPCSLWQQADSRQKGHHVRVILSSAVQSSTASHILCSASLMIAKCPSLCCLEFDVFPVARRAWGEADTQCNSGLLHGLRACRAASQASRRLNAVLAGVCEYSLATNKPLPFLCLTKVSAPCQCLMKASKVSTLQKDCSCSPSVAQHART